MRPRLGMRGGHAHCGHGLASSSSTSAWHGWSSGQKHMRSWPAKEPNLALRCAELREPDGASRRRPPHRGDRWARAASVGVLAPSSRPNSAGDWTPLDQPSAIAASKSHTLAEYAAPWLADRTASALPHSTRTEAGM